LHVSSGTTNLNGINGDANTSRGTMGVTKKGVEFPQDQTLVSLQPFVNVWVAAVLGVAAAGAPAPRQNTEKEILQRFQQRIDEYVALHRRLEKDMPPP
jgi:hypothetical protein